MNLSIFKKGQTPLDLLSNHAVAGVPGLPKAGLLVCALTLSLSAYCQAQKLTSNEQKKVAALRVRLNKAESAQSRANATLGQYRVFRIMGEVRAGDTTYARLWGKAVPYTNDTGAGSLLKDSILYVKSPINDEYRNGNYDGFCTFVGVVNGTNTYYPLARQAGYTSAKNQADKWSAITSSIQAEIDAVYLPYRRKEKAQSEKREVEQERIAQAQERLAQAKREVEVAKQNRLNQQQENADLAHIEAETAKAKAEQTRIEAQTKREQDELARQKAKQLEETTKRNQAAIELLKNTPSIIAGRQLGKVHLGMTEAEVLQNMGAPASSIQLRKPARLGMGDYDVKFVPSRFRRDRYFLNAIDGLDIRYEGSDLELSDLSQERGFGTIKQGDLKIKFVFDVIFLDGKVVQIESDSLQFFTAAKKNLTSSEIFDGMKGMYATHSPIEVFLPVDEEGHIQYSYYGNTYAGSQTEGLSFCFEFIRDKNTTGYFPDSRTKVIIHHPNTIPFTGDYQYGIRLWVGGTYKDSEENAEERYRYGHM